MPIVDWTRTQLDFKLPTDGLALKFNYLQIIIFEMYILKLKNLEERYSNKQIKNAEKLFKLMKTNDIKNLKLICDDFRNQKFDKKFNLIISSGVIHHLDEPNTALKFFYDNLTDQGVLFLMVYGNQQSESIKGLKDVFKKFELSLTDSEKINFLNPIHTGCHILRRNIVGMQASPSDSSANTVYPSELNTWENKSFL